MSEAKIFAISFSVMMSIMFIGFGVSMAAEANAESQIGEACVKSNGNWEFDDWNRRVCRFPETRGH